MRGVRMEAEWTPRDPNQEADDLSFLEASGFGIHISWKQGSSSMSKKDQEAEERRAAPEEEE